MHFAFVSKNIGKIMTECAFESTLEDETFYGMRVEILKEYKDLYKVKTHYHYEGFMPKSDLEIDENIVTEYNAKEKLMVINSFADVLSVPSVRGVILITLPQGSQIAKLSAADDSGWIKVQLINGVVGFIKEKFVATCINSLIADTYQNYQLDLEPKERIRHFVNHYLNINEDTFRNNVTKTAMSYLGTPYRWGGKSPLGIDCSGLSSMAYMLNGLIIYRDSTIKEGFPVYAIDINAIKKADLLFAKGHVMLYIGNDNYIHSTGKNGSDGVVINSLNPNHKNYREDLAKGILQVGSVF